MQQQQNDRKHAIENCIRSFIIKSIHAIVQARNGIVYNTNCISAVGARNNLMVNIEEDPEIGATIKQTLDAGFPVRVHDCLSLEILSAWPSHHTRMVAEVWQFRLDTADHLDGLNKLPEQVDEQPQQRQIEELAVDDLRQSRLFEKLGTLLKAVIVATRFLPAYRLSRNQDPSTYQMCYILRRGETNLERLGSETRSLQIGRLLSGLAVQTPASDPSSVPTDQAGPPISKQRVFLSCTVHYRSPLVTNPPEPIQIPVQEFTRVSKIPTHPHITSEERPSSSNRRTRTRVSAEFTNPRTAVPTVCGMDYDRHLTRVRPAFIDNSNLPDGLIDDPTGGLVPPHLLYDSPYMDDPLDRLAHLNLDGSVTDENEDHHSEDDAEATDLSETIHPRHLDHPLDDEDDGEDEDDAIYDGRSDKGIDDDLRLNRIEPPLQLPFSTVGVSGDRLTQMFVDLRERANLDLFQVPGSGGPGGTTGQTVSQVQSALFDADALSDELERHEKMLKEFDDFLADFCQLDPYGPAEVRTLATSPIRPGPLGTD